MENTSNLTMPLLVPNQSQKEITHNEALIILDSVVQNGVISKNLNTPPENPQQNDLYIIAENAIDKWLNRDFYIAFYYNGWRFLKPKCGYIFWVKEENCNYIYNGESWEPAIKQEIKQVSIGDLGGVNIEGVEENDVLIYNNGNFVNKKLKNDFDKLYVNYSSEGEENAEIDGNKLIVKGDLSLFSAENVDCRLAINRAEETGNASIKLKSNGVDRVEFGLLGDGNFTLKISNDGENWNSGFVVDGETGNVDFKGEISINGNSLMDAVGGGSSFTLQNTDSSKVGYFYNFGSVISSRPLVLPSGGTWWYRIFWCNSSGQSYATNTWYTNNKNIFGGVVAGGTSIQNGNYYGNGFAIKIQ